MRSIFYVHCMMFAALIVLTGCQGSYMDTAYVTAGALGLHELNLFQNPDVNLRSKNYAAADYLIQQAETYVDKEDTIQVKPLVNYRDPNTPADIGVVLPEQIGERLTQLGYRVDPSLVASAATKEAVPMDTSRAPDFILSGHYEEDRPNMNVSLRITDAKTKRIVGAFDYTMPTNREIRALANPKPQIIIKRP